MMKCRSCDKSLTKETARMCSRCQNKSTVYCCRDCQKTDYKRHKKEECKSSKEASKQTGKQEVDISTELQQSLSISSSNQEDVANSTPTTSAAARQDDSSTQEDTTTAATTVIICPKCHVNDMTLGSSLMCFYCGRFLVCDCCVLRPEVQHNVDDADSNVIDLCDDCVVSKRHVLDSRTPIGVMLQDLLQRKPSGPHVPYCRLMLAQCRLTREPLVTGVEYDLPQAKRELLTLAKDEQYALAQYTVATLVHNDSTGVYTGPLDCLDMEAMENPFGSIRNPRKAIPYYKQAVSQNLQMAKNDMAVMYKNGDLVDIDKAKAMELFRDCVQAGSPSAMCNLGQMLCRGDGVPVQMQEGIELYRRAANEYDWASAQFMLFQFSMTEIFPVSEDEGKRMMNRLLDKDFEGLPPGMLEMIPPWLRE